MTKKKKIYYLLAGIQLILTIAILIWYNVHDTKMGIVRHVTFWNNYKFPKLFSENILIIIYIIFLIIVAIILLKSRIYLKTAKFDLIYLVIMYLIMYSFITYSNLEKNILYYYIIIYLISITTCQVLKILLTEND